jgi:hypothetical protein
VSFRDRIFSELFTIRESRIEQIESTSDAFSLNIVFPLSLSIRRALFSFRAENSAWTPAASIRVSLIKSLLRVVLSIRDSLNENITLRKSFWDKSIDRIEDAEFCDAVKSRATPSVCKEFIPHRLRLILSRSEEAIPEASLKKDSARIWVAFIESSFNVGNCFSSPVICCPASTSAKYPIPSSSILTMICQEISGILTDG